MVLVLLMSIELGTNAFTCDMFQNVFIIRNLFLR